MLVSQYFVGKACIWAKILLSALQTTNIKYGPLERTVRASETHTSAEDKHRLLAEPTAGPSASCRAPSSTFWDWGFQWPPPETGKWKLRSKHPAQPRFWGSDPLLAPVSHSRPESPSPTCQMLELHYITIPEGFLGLGKIIPYPRFWNISTHFPPEAS